MILELQRFMYFLAFYTVYVFCIVYTGETKIKIRSFPNFQNSCDDRDIPLLLILNAHFIILKNRFVKTDRSLIHAVTPLM